MSNLRPARGRHPPGDHRHARSRICGIADLEAISGPTCCATSWAWIRLRSVSPSRWRWSAPSTASCDESDDRLAAAVRRMPARCWRLIAGSRAAQGFGDVLAEGSQRAAERDRRRRASGMPCTSKGWRWSASSRARRPTWRSGYATAPIGPRYDICEHDWDFDTEVGWDHTLNSSRTLGILDRIPMEYLGADKVRNFKALATIWSAADALDLCIFAIAPTRCPDAGGHGEPVGRGDRLEHLLVRDDAASASGGST